MLHNCDMLVSIYINENRYLHSIFWGRVAEAKVLNLVNDDDDDENDDEGNGDDNNMYSTMQKQIHVHIRVCVYILIWNS